LHDELGVIHRDIKPDNILFCSEKNQVKLTDFTIARENIKEESRLFDGEGTASFTAPECHIVSKEGY
jgi:serine/threonine protein kinase